jgi:hypothetical protein
MAGYQPERNGMVTGGYQSVVQANSPEPKRELGNWVWDGCSGVAEGMTLPECIIGWDPKVKDREKTQVHSQSNIVCCFDSLSGLPVVHSSYISSQKNYGDFGEESFRLYSCLGLYNQLMHNL